MNYKTFQLCVKEELKGYFPDTYDIRLDSVLKNNGVRWDALVIQNDRDAAAPTIYLEPYWSRHEQEGLSAAQAATEIFDCYCANDISDELDIAYYKDFARVRNAIVSRLVNYEKNVDFLETVPHTRMLDLAVVYFYTFDLEPDTAASIVVTYEHLAMWDVTAEALEGLALENSLRLMQPLVRDLRSLIGELGVAGIEPDAGIQMLVLTNERKLYGAVCITYPKVLRALADSLGTDLMIIPSSVHEVILMPVDTGMDAELLNEMVAGINREAVAETEVLSDHVYVYSRESDQISAYAS